MMIGKIVRLTKFFSAFNDIGDRYELSPGDLFLILDHNSYDTTFLSYGVVLYGSTRELQEYVCSSL